MPLRQIFRVPDHILDRICPWILIQSNEPDPEHRFVYETSYMTLGIQKLFLHNSCYLLS